MIRGFILGMGLGFVAVVIGCGGSLFIMWLLGF